MVVGPGHGDMSKYTGEGVALCSTSSTQGGPYRINHINYGHFGVFSRRHALDVLRLKRIILFVDVTLFNDAMMSYVMSRCHMHWSHDHLL